MRSLPSDGDATLDDTGRRIVSGLVGKGESHAVGFTPGCSAQELARRAGPHPGALGVAEKEACRDEE